MSFKTKIISTNQIVNVLESETVLEAALRQGVPYPYSCKAGLCGACESRLKVGTIEHLNHLRFTLTEQEKAEGLFLACRSILKSDSELSWLSARESQDFSVDATVIEKKRLTHDTWHITLRGLGSAWAYATNPANV